MDMINNILYTSPTFQGGLTQIGTKSRISRYRDSSAADIPFNH